MTSNRTREIHDALKRRSLYHWIDLPSVEKELEILSARVPELPERLARQVAVFVHELRDQDLYKTPGSRRLWIGRAHCSSWAVRNSMHRPSSKRWPAC